MEEQLQQKIKQTLQKPVYSISNLFAAKELSFPGYIDQLADWKVVNYLDETQFKQYMITNGAEEGNEFCKEIFYLEQQMKKRYGIQKDDYITVFPIVCNSDKIYERRILEQYFIESKIQRDLLDFSLEPEIFFNQEEQQDLEKSQCQPEEETVTEQQKEKNYEQPKIEQTKDSQPVVKKPTYRLPFFLLTTSQQQRSASTLMSINVTQEFSQELGEVKEVFKRQLKESGWVINTYRTFLIDFLNYRSIIEGHYEVGKDEKQASQISNRLKQLINRKNTFGNDQYHFIQEVWNALLRKIEAQKEIKYKNIEESIQKICLQGLDKVFLNSNYLPTSYGSTLNGYILININQVSKEIDQKMLRKGPLKPYIAICLYQQIAHYLVRQYLSSQFNENNSSFSTDKDSIGKNFIELIKQLNIQAIQKKVACLIDPKFDKKQSLQMLDQGLSKLQEIFDKYRQRLEILRKNEENIKSVKRSLELLFFPYRFDLCSKGIQIDEKWGQIYNYIDFLSQKKSSSAILETNDEILDKEQKYQLFFSLLLTDSIVKRWLKASQQPIENWTPYRQKLIKFKQSHQYNPQYYFQQVDYLDELVEKTIGAVYNSLKFKDRFDLGVISRYITAVLFQNCFSQTNQKITCLLKNLPEQQTFLIVKNKLQNCLKKMPLLKPEVKDQIDIKHYPLLKLASLKQQENEQFLSSILQLSETVKYASHILSWAPLWKIMLQLPNFFSIKNQARSFQSGYEIERRLFGRADIDVIYAKDFQLMKNMDDPQKRAQIGVQPSNFEDMIQRVIVAKHGRVGKKIDISSNGCGVHWRNQQRAKIRALKQLREAKMKESALNA